MQAFAKATTAPAGAPLIGADGLVIGRVFNVVVASAFGARTAR